ncbi:unnamed protein product [Brassicogethes aeneus]|uniref:Uncharacterized protein n=1 Tax=Brassicogethes aeneus TaxID=1431903 RepID=A0A9P0FBL5_BRAAE|nr:unnamed protein product [Brassicogethes aeneus]
MLPTYEEVIKFYEWNRHKIKNDKETKKEPSYKELETVVVARIKEIWAKASIPIVQRKRVKAMLQTYHLKCKNLLKSNPKIPENKEFRRSSKALFDISSCKCKEMNNCTCPREKKIPVRKQSFLIDQRTARKMVMGTVDIDATNQMRNTLKRKLLRQKSLCKPQKESKEEPNISTSFTSSESDRDDVPQPQLPAVTIDYTLLSKKCDRFGVSDRAGAAIASAVLHSTNVGVIDKNKLRRKRKKTRENIVEQNKILHVPALYFDGRKDKTLTLTEKDGQYYRQSILEEHISLIKEPESKFLGYIAPNSETSKSIEQTINDFFLESSIPMESLLAVGCDGTNVNVGKKGGIIRLLEQRLNRPLQWIICLLHMKELPLRHLFIEVDGTTSGPQTFSGPIGKMLEKCETRPVIQFRPIPAELPEVTAKDLSTDQKYLYKIVSAVYLMKIFNYLSNKKEKVKYLSYAKTVTEASGTLCSKSDREGFIKAEIESRTVMPKIDSKKDFVA